MAEGEFIGFSGIGGAVISALFLLLRLRKKASIDMRTMTIAALITPAALILLGAGVLLFIELSVPASGWREMGSAIISVTTVVCALVAFLAGIVTCAIIAKSSRHTEPFGRHR